MTDVAQKTLFFKTMCLYMAVALVAWQLLPDQYMGPHNAWNPHAIMEFVIAICSISLAGKFAIDVLGTNYGLLLTGLMGGFASSTATIHTMGTVATSQPHLADRAALGGVFPTWRPCCNWWCC